MVETIGQTLTTRDEKTGEDVVLYTPDFGELSECKKQMERIIPLDNRPHAQLFAMNRQYQLEFREADIRAKRGEGKFVSGR